MRRSSLFSPLRWISLFLVFAAITLTLLQLVSYSRVRAYFPIGMLVGNIPVGGLDRQQAAERLLQAYDLPVEIHYNDAVIQIKPSEIDFQLDLNNMLAAADLARVNQPFWEGFWDSLWNRAEVIDTVPLRSSFAEDRLRTFLTDEVAARYDKPATPAQPIPGSANFSAGQTGVTLDVDSAVAVISDALSSPDHRVVNLSYNQTSVPRPIFQNLEVLLKQVIDLSQFTGIVELYLADMQTEQTIHFAYQTGETAPIPLNIAFSGWSTIKIPLLTSAMIHMKDYPPSAAVQTMEKNMIELSDNASADLLAQTVIDKNIAPVIVSQDMQTLGLLDTFWGGFFAEGAPLLRRYVTPANQRTDINTGPDPYDQTTPADLGFLLEDIYQCSQSGGGSLVAAFPGQITQQKCLDMIDLLAHNDIPVLIQAGVPAGTRVAHKHGWANETDGLIHTMGDAAIVYSPGGNYILVVFVHDPVQVIFDPANQMVAELSTAVYNYFNVPTQ